MVDHPLRDGPAGRAVELRAQLGGIADLRHRKNLRPYGFGPLNGQERRRELLHAIAAVMTFDLVVETGTFRGTSTGYLKDDFAVPDDPGYGFASYGPGATLTEKCLPNEALHGWNLFYPVARSEDKTGARRGCCVLKPPATTLDIPELRHARSF